jgi:hypothetical protein
MPFPLQRVGSKHGSASKAKATHTYNSTESYVSCLLDACQWSSMLLEARTLAAGLGGICCSHIYIYLALVMFLDA